MSSKTCDRCKKTFRYPSDLKAHERRKTSCAPIAEQEDLTEADRQKLHACRYCGRRFGSQISMYRHVRHNCKIANSEEGMDKLMEHTLQRQLAAQGQQLTEMRAENAEMKEQMGRLEALLEKQLALGEPALPSSATVQIRTAAPAQVYTGPVTNTQNIVAILPWDGERRIEVSVAQIAAAFAENSRLKEYARLPECELTDPDIAPPYVTELFLDLTKRGHADPAARNVYLNPRRADQALVHMASGKWEVLPLAEATRMLFDGVAETIHKVARTYAELRQLPLEAQNALALAGMVYEDGPEEYVKRAKAPMSAHLANMVPARLLAQ